MDGVGRAAVDRCVVPNARHDLRVRGGVT